MGTTIEISDEEAENDNFLTDKFRDKVMALLLDGNSHAKA
jgi:hypothetical protein